jgi:hypothetical protein
VYCSIASLFFPVILFHSHLFPIKPMSRGTQFVCWACTRHCHPHQINKYRITEQILKVTEQNKKNS